MLNVYDYLSSQPSKYRQLKVKDLLFVHYHCPQDNDRMDIYTNYNFISYTISGERVMNRPGKSFDVTEGKCVFVKKGAYSQQRRYESDWCILAFFMPDSYLQHFIQEYRGKLQLRAVPKEPGEVIHNVDVTETTRSFFYGMLPYLLQEIPPSEDLMELKFRELLFNVLCNPENADLLSHVCNIRDSKKPSLIEVMESNFMYNLSLEEYSKIAHRSLSSFKREFASIFNTTPGIWLTQKRLQFASILLETSTKTINEVACDAGFENATHFSRIFKEKFGTPPLQYRKRRIAMVHA